MHDRLDSHTKNPAVRASVAIVHEKSGSLLIQNAEINDDSVVDVRCRNGVIAEVAHSLVPRTQDRIVEANRCALIPGLHDHHMHLLALAAQFSSVQCGPPEVSNVDELLDALESVSGTGWIRGVGYHESVAGDLDRATLDTLCRDRPVRIQHRSGRLWILNTQALKELDLNASGDGQMFRMDRTLRSVFPPLDSLREDVSRIGDHLLSMGITGVTDATPFNDEGTRGLICSLLGSRLRVFLMGNEQLSEGPLKLLIDDYDLPPIDSFERRIAVAHDCGRPVAIHCVSRVELVFALSALQAVGSIPGDRIEHASVVEEDTLNIMQELDLTVVTQPNFILERGDQYVHDMGPDELDSLFRVRGLLDAGMRVGGGTDAPFGSCNPWKAIWAAVNRTTRDGRVIGTRESIDPDRALELFTTRPESPGGPSRRVCVGEAADLCLLNKRWSDARNDLSTNHVRLTVVDGDVVYEIAADESRGSGSDA